MYIAYFSLFCILPCVLLSLYVCVCVLYVCVICCLVGVINDDDDDNSNYMRYKCNAKFQRCTLSHSVRSRRFENG